MSRALKRTVGLVALLAMLLGVVITTAATPAGAAPAPVVGIGDVSVVEGNTPGPLAQPVSVPITLTAPQASDVVVTWQITGGSASTVSDFKAIPKPRTTKLRAGKTRAFANINVYGDIAGESDETVEITITGATVVGIGKAVGSVTLADDDAPASSGGVLLATGSNGNGVTGLGTDVGNTLTFTQAGSATNWASIDASTFHNVGVKQDGTLWAWGSNNQGATGLGLTTGTTLVPTQVGSASNWADASAGGVHSLGIRTDGTLWAWGYNSFGRTGLGTDVGAATTPTQVGSGTNWVAVSAGLDHSLAVRSDGTLWSWGYNGLGQLGQGDTSERLVPTQVGSATTWAFVNGSGDDSSAIRTDGTLWTWGSNTLGRTGLGIDTGTTLAPTQVGSDSDWAAVSGAPFGATRLGLRADGTLWSWGYNSNGATGLGTSSGSTLTPTQIGADADWAQASVGNGHSVGVRTDGTLWSWGTNSLGATGLGVSTGENWTPVQVGSAATWEAVSAGGYHTLAIGEPPASGEVSIGDAVAVEGDAVGPKTQIVKVPITLSDVQPGDVTVTWQLTGGTASSPTDVKAIPKPKNVKIRAGKVRAFASIALYGDVAPEGDEAVELTITAVTGTAAIGKALGTVTLQDDDTLGQTLWSWGQNAGASTGLGTEVGNALVPTQAGTASDWVLVDVGAHSLGVMDDGTLWSWGNNSTGVTGLGTATGTTLVPTQVGTDTNWASVSAGNQHSLGVRTDGTLWSWGNNNFAATGLGTSAGTTLVPTQVGTDTNWAYVSAGAQHSLGIRTDGTLWAWGYSTDGRLGIGTPAGLVLSPVQVGTATNWASASAWRHSLGVRTDGTLWSWGSNSEGATGLGIDTGNTLVPAQVGVGTDWGGASAAGGFGIGLMSLALRTDGTLWSWGDNALGATGLGVDTGTTLVPTQVGSATDWTSMSAGGVHSLAIRSDGTLWSWGSNGQARTGLGTLAGTTLAPTQVGAGTDWLLASAGNVSSLGIRST
jgi:alpha-tubulin suppressor-like RCC1 family protein